MGPGFYRPHALQEILRGERIDRKTLVPIAAYSCEIMTLAARVWHDVEVLALGRVRVPENCALSGPDDIEDMGRYIALCHGALLILVEFQGVLSINVNVLQLTGLRHVARCAVAPGHLRIVGC